MKTKITRKAIKERFENIISVPYCSLQMLLHEEDADYYCTRIEGWACDVYIFGDVAISTGYAPFGNIKPSYELIKKYDAIAGEICFREHDYETRKKLLSNLIADFIGDCLKEGR